MKFQDIDLSCVQVTKMRGPPTKRFGQVMVGENSKEKLMFQVPGSRLLFEPNEYNSILVSIANEEFIGFLEELRNVILSELITVESIDMGLKVSSEYNPSFRVKLSDETGYYDVHGKRTTKEEVLQKGHDIHILCQLHCTYQIDGRTGVSWKAVQIRKGETLEKKEAEVSEKEEDYQFLD